MTPMRPNFIQPTTVCRETPRRRAASACVHVLASAIGDGTTLSSPFNSISIFDLVPGGAFSTAFKNCSPVMQLVLFARSGVASVVVCYTHLALTTCLRHCRFVTTKQTLTRFYGHENFSKMPFRRKVQNGIFVPVAAHVTYFASRRRVCGYKFGYNLQRCKPK